MLTLRSRQNSVLNNYSKFITPNQLIQIFATCNQNNNLLTTLPTVGNVNFSKLPKIPLDGGECAKTAFSQKIQGRDNIHIMSTYVCLNEMETSQTDRRHSID